MGRLSGFFIWSATFLLAVISVCRLPEELTPKQASTRSRRAGNSILEVRTVSTSTREQRSATATCKATLSGPDPDQLAVCRILAPAGCVIVVGSTDVSGATHEVSVEAHCSAFTSKRPDVPTDALTVKAERWHLADHPMQEVEEKRKSESRWMHSRQTLSCTPSLSRAIATHSLPASQPGPAQATQRRFLIPHFEADSVRQEPSVATAICSTQRVTVFIDDNLLSSRSKSGDANGAGTPLANRSDNAVAHAERICDLVESQLMDTIADWICPISDLDNDGRLSIVMTDLDRRSVPGETPVLGCVRERDFQEHETADFAGDIVYLDYRLPQGDELAALLAHELTHAAAASLQLELTAQPNQRSIRIQPWLNEAAAHWVELQFCHEPAGFSERVRLFQANPAACPIVAPEALVPLATRRAGSRVSAVSFLQQFITEPRNIYQLLVSQQAFDETVSNISGQSFEETFRAWSIQQSLHAQQLSTPGSMKQLQDGQCTTTKLHGTSFVVVHGGDATCEVDITSRSSAQLQVTLLMSGRRKTLSPQVTAANVD